MQKRRPRWPGDEAARLAALRRYKILDTEPERAFEDSLLASQICGTPGKGWPESDVMAVELALQEAVANGIRHGCKGGMRKKKS